MRLRAALAGSVAQPAPRGAFRPSSCLIALTGDVRAAMRLLSDGVRKPMRMVSSERIDANGNAFGLHAAGAPVARASNIRLATCDQLGAILGLVLVPEIQAAKNADY